MFMPLGDTPELPIKAGRGRSRGDLLYYLRRVWSGSTWNEVQELEEWQRKAWRNKVNQSVKNPLGQPYEIAQGNGQKEKVGQLKKRTEEIVKDRERKEICFFLNGVVTDHWISQLNAEHLAAVFRRKIQILYKPTYGLDRDLRECIRGRLKQKLRVATKLLGGLKREAEGKGKKRIVLIAHSEGTIIASHIMGRLPAPLRERMEVYNFAFCADQFPANACRLVEHIVNEGDLVPSLSIVPKNYYDVPGNIYRQPGKSGHLLSLHYLPDFRQGKYRDVSGRLPKLFQYIDGANYGK
jgi:hypothetical protein